MLSKFEELKVWQKAKAVAVEIYKITEAEKICRDYGLRDQMRRSAVSVPSNIAEGDERETDKEAIRFFYISKGSVAELRTQLQIACEVGYIDEKFLNKTEDKCKEVAKMLGALIKARRR